MASSSNNIEQEIFLWQELVLSNQPGGLLSTALFIEMSIAILFIMTLLKEEEKEEKEKYYYNVLSGKMTILLVIISGIISGKGFEILFRTLHIWSCAYGKVGFSLNDIFISLSFGFSLVCFGSSLLFNKKLHVMLRLQKSVNTKLKEIMDIFKKREAEYKKKGSDKEAIMDGLNQIVVYVETIMEITKLKWFWEQEIIDDLKRMVKVLEQTVDIPEVKIRTINRRMVFFRTRVRDLEAMVIRPEAMLNYLEKEKEQMATLEAIGYGLKAALDRLEAYKAEMLAELEAKKPEFKAARVAVVHKKRLASAKAIVFNKETPILLRLEATRTYLELKMVDNPEVNVPKLQETIDEINKRMPYLKAIMAIPEATVDEIEKKAKIFEELRSKLKKVNVIGLEEIVDELEAARAATVDELEAARAATVDELEADRAATVAELEAARAATVAELEERNGRNISIVARLKEMVASFFST
ncbi:hypothetical protein GINT2_001889 [Glugoides intestinalis]